MATKIQIRRDTAANWEATNPVLSQGEPGHEIDTGKVKYGNGTSDWRTLAYDNDFVSTPADGVNDNKWRVVEVKGYKEFDYVTAGHKKVHIPITSGLAGTVSQITVNLAGQDLTALRDSYDVGSNIRVYLNDLRNNDYSVGAIEGAGFVANGSLSADEYVIKWNGGDLTLVEGEELTLQYYTRGTKDLYGAWNEYDTFVPDETHANTNQVVLDFNTFDYLSADDIAALKTNHTSNCSITFWTNGEGQVDINRKIVSVANTGNLYTITFDGTPLDIATPTLTTMTVTHSRNTDGNNNYIEFDSKRYPEFYQCIGAQNNKYTGNAYRSGYVIINGDTNNPYDFYNENYITNEGMFVIQLSTSYTINPTDTVEIHYYKAPTSIALYIYRPEQQNNYYYGKKWFDWTKDLPRQYYNFVGNGVQSGTIKTHVTLYDQATNQWNTANFPFALFDTNNYWDTWNSSSYGAIYPFDNFDQDGLYFYSDWTGWGDSRTVKVRIMYSMELMVTENQNFYWF